MSFIVFLRDSQYGMPAMQSVHLVGITVLLASMLVLNLRLAGLAMVDTPLVWLARQLKPWALGALTVVVLSGLLIFVGTPSKYLASNPFRFKMGALLVATLFQFAVLRRFSSVELSRARTVKILIAVLSLTLWFSVGWAGRAIAFVP
jgi:hypothetical protein